MNESLPSSNRSAQDELWYVALHGDRQAGLQTTLARINAAIDAGADPNGCNHNGEVMLRVLISQAGLGLAPLVQVLCDRGANPLLGNLVHHCAMNFSTMTPDLVDACVRGSYRDEEGGDILCGLHQWASAGMDEEWVSDLLNVAVAAGATLDVLDHQGRSALHRLWSINYADMDMLAAHFASNQWMITDQLYRKGLIQHHLADPSLLALIKATGYLPNQCHQEMGHYAVMDQVEALIEAAALDTATATPAIDRTGARPRI